MLRAIYRAPTRQEAKAKIVEFAGQFHVHERAIATLVENQERLLTFYDFPKGHWLSIKTTNPIESTFAPVRSRLNKAKRIHSLPAGLALVHQSLLARLPRLHRIVAYKRVAAVLSGEEYRDGLAVDQRIRRGL